ncbi:MAG: hypothetical protein KF742_09800 [Cryobacterium sp.]|nr:hypothetical protein [Cryobacterium sp.]MCW5796839.1 hypothetical protein [Nitrospira sp.]
MVAQSLSKPTLDSVRSMITDWRAEHKAPIPFPAVVWEQAVQLAKEFGLGPTARALKLDYGCLKKRSGHPAPTRSKSADSPLFFELFQSTAPAIDNCVLLLDTQRGCKVRLEFGPTAPAALAAFVRELG